jgi:glutathione S-transferase
LTLNYKGVQHKTEWIEYPDIEPTCKKVGARPTAQRPDGSDYYSVPFIIDSQTGAVVSDSWTIALYLEENYPAPEYKSLFPENSHVMLFAFNQAFGKIFPHELVDLVKPITAKSLNPSSIAYYEPKNATEYGCPLEEVSPPGPKRDALWTVVRRGLDALAVEFDRNGEDALFFMGDRLSYADVILAGWLMWDQVALPTDEWEMLMGLNGGRWGRFIAAFEQYQGVF